MKIIEGDLIKLALEGEFDLIVHGCNCFCTMGAGIAKKIKEFFPEAYEADLKTEKGSSDKIGSISSVTVTRGNSNITVVNGYTQYSPIGNGILVDYEAVDSVFKEITPLLRDCILSRQPGAVHLQRQGCDCCYSSFVMPLRLGSKRRLRRSRFCR